MIPETDLPETTEGYQGFYHLLGIESHCEEAKLAYIIRDHDRDKFEDRKAFIADCVKKINEKYGEGTCEAEIYDQYYNMKETIYDILFHNFLMLLYIMYSVSYMNLQTLELQVEAHHYLP